MYTLQDADGGLQQELQYEALVSCRTDGRQVGEQVMDSETGSIHTNSSAATASSMDCRSVSVGRASLRRGHPIYCQRHEATGR
jgi:hypothetical protein